MQNNYSCSENIKDQIKQLRIEYVNNSYEHYDCIGFDADHCLLRYNIRPFTKILYESFVEFFLNSPEFTKYQESHPQVNQKEFLLDYSEEQFGLGSNYCVVDREENTVLKVCKGKQVVIGYSRFIRLSEEELQSTYGQEKIIDFNTENPRAGNKRYFLCTGYYDHIYAFSFMKLDAYFTLIGLRLKGYDLWEHHVGKAIWGSFNHYDSEKTFKINEYGYFFPKMIKYVDSIMCKQNKMRIVLEKLRKEKKTVFLLTNSHFEFLNLNMKAAYGEDWQDLFDIIKVYGQKPGFFTDSSKATYLYDESTPTLKSESVFTVEDVEKHDFETQNKIFINGNHSIIEKYMETKKRILNPKIAYFGDSYTGDCLFTEKLSNWNSFYICEEIVEEMQVEEIYQSQQQNNEKNQKIWNVDLINYQKYWGSFFYHYDEKQSTLVPSMMSDLLKQNIKGGVLGRVDTDFALKNLWKLQI